MARPLPYTVAKFLWLEKEEKKISHRY